MRADGWSEAKLRELVVAGGLQTGPFGGQLHADEYVADGVPVVMPQDIIAGEISTEHIARASEEKAASLAPHRLRTGDLVFARRGDIGRVGIARDRETGWLCGTGCLRARPSERVSPVYLHYAVRRASSIAWLNIHAVGQTMLNLNTSILGQLPADVPPLPEQRAIAAVLDTIDDAIQKTEQIIAKLQQVKQGLLHDLLTRGIDDNGELRDPERHPEQFQDSPLGRIPKGWDVVALEQVASVERGQFTHRPRNDPALYGGEYPFVQTGDVSTAQGDVLDHFSQTLNTRGIAVSKEFSRGTIAVTIAANIADTAILGRPMYFPDSIVGVTVRSGDVVRFVELCIRRAKPRLEARAPQSAQKNINLQDLRPLRIVRPPRTEQEHISGVFESVTARLMIESESLIQLKALKSGLTDDLLTGRVRTTSLPECAA
jgi:type I restriction enzyme S subunit